MKILVDADACSKIRQIEDIARKNGIQVKLFCDTSRIIESDYSEVKFVSCGKDAVDFAIINNCERGDIVVTNDSGLASLILVKGGVAVNSYGLKYDNRNVTGMLSDKYYRSRAVNCRKKKHSTSRSVYRNIYNYHDHPGFMTTLNQVVRQGA